MKKIAPAGRGIPNAMTKLPTAHHATRRKDRSRLTRTVTLVSPLTLGSQRTSTPLIYLKGFAPTQLLEVHPRGSGPRMAIGVWIDVRERSAALYWTLSLDKSAAIRSKAACGDRGETSS
jgi:hypothetical protein